VIFSEAFIDDSKEDGRVPYYINVGITDSEVRVEFNEYPTQEVIQESVETALTEAKNSGEFDGRGIVSISRTSGNGAPGTRDTYTIYYTDNTTSTFNVVNGYAGPMGPAGRGISFISLVGSSGSSSTTGVIDTYKIQYTDGTFDSFTVRNGKDGKDGATTEGEQREPQVF
jgi:hypothetical protein